MRQHFLFDQGSSTIVTFILVWNYINQKLKKKYTSHEDSGYKSILLLRYNPTHQYFTNKTEPFEVETLYHVKYHHTPADVKNDLRYCAKSENLARSQVDQTIENKFASRKFNNIWQLD